MFSPNDKLYRGCTPKENFLNWKKLVKPVIDDKCPFPVWREYGNFSFWYFLLIVPEGNTKPILEWILTLELEKILYAVV